MFESYYQMLQVTGDSSFEEIKASFRSLSKKSHPDIHNNSPESNARFRMLLNAYTVLTDPVMKEEYDNYLRMSSVFSKLGTSTPSEGNLLPAGERDFLKSPDTVFSHLNYLLWDIENFIGEIGEAGLDRMYGDRTARHFLLVVLTFIDKWVLETAGYPDYFMEARQKEKIDPPDYISILESGMQINTHIPYTGAVDYFYDIRKRMDRFLDSAKLNDLMAEVPGTGVRLIDCILEAQNYSVHYLSCLLTHETERSIPKFRHSCDGFEW